jgi:hypothetical protein
MSDSFNLLRLSRWFTAVGCAKRVLQTGARGAPASRVSNELNAECDCDVAK